MSPVLRGCLWMSGAILSFSAMAIAGREVSTNLDTFEIMLYRSLIGFLIVLAVSSLAGTRGDIKTDRLPLHLIRNLCHFTAAEPLVFRHHGGPIGAGFRDRVQRPAVGLAHVGHHPERTPHQ